MSFFTQQTRVVELDEQNRVTLRKLSYGQASEATSRAFKVNPFTQSAEMDYPRLRAEQLHRAVVAWEGPGFEGRPVTVDNIDALPTWITDKLLDVMSDINDNVTADEGNESGALTNT
jgi:hypothetical protein